MILKHQIITDIRIESVNDLYKLKPFLEDGTLKINKSQIARELEVDRRTVDKYINGYTKSETRNCDDCITPFYDTITELLSDKNQQVFYYRKVLWQYLVDNHGFKGVYCNFCHYLRKYPEFDSYFRKSKPSNTNKVTVRYETPMFNYKGCQYSVPPEYIDKIVSLQVYDGYIHVYCNTEFITIHQLSSKKLNYISEHYAAIARKSHIFRDEHIMDRAKENLEIIGKVYDYE